MNLSAGRKPQQGLEHFSAKKGNQLGAQLVPNVGRAFQHGLLGNDFQLGPLLHAENHQGLVEDEQVQLELGSYVRVVWSAHIWSFSVS